MYVVDQFAICTPRGLKLRDHEACSCIMNMYNQLPCQGQFSPCAVLLCKIRLYFSHPAYIADQGGTKLEEAV